MYENKKMSVITSDYDNKTDYKKIIFSVVYLLLPW